MKATLLMPLLLFYFTTSLFGQKAPASADEIMKEAYTTAKKENKKKRGRRERTLFASLYSLRSR